MANSSTSEYSSAVCKARSICNQQGKERHSGGWTALDEEAATASRRTRQYKRRQMTVKRKQSTAAKGRERIPRKAIDRSSRKVDINIGDLKQSKAKGKCI